MNSRTFYCLQLGKWLHEQDWYFKTLLSACIETTVNLASDTDELVNDLLLAHPKKPGKDIIVNFLVKSPRVRQWFLPEVVRPQIATLSLQEYSPVLPTNQQLPALATVDELASWLNVTRGQLEWLADLRRFDSTTPAHFIHYHYRVVAKRNGQQRLLESPKLILKSIQRKILLEILQFAPVHDAAHGFRKHRSCLSHASKHVDRQYLFVFDLADCFHSIRWLTVYRVFIRLGFSSEVTRYLTALCTHRVYASHPLLRRLDANSFSHLRHRHIAQGAPTSPALANAALFTVDRRLAGLARSLNLNYSRYADDLAFSGDVHRDWGFFESLVGAICLEEGFTLNHRKSRCLRPHQRQMLTGVVVNQKTNIDRRYYDRIKAVLTNCARNGLHSQNHSNHQDFRAHLFGRVQFVKSLNAQKGAKLEALFKTIA